MNRLPRPTGEPAITRRMWSGIFFVAVVMAAGTGGLIEGFGSMPYAQTMAFTTLMMFRLFNVLNARSEAKRLEGLFRNGWL